MYNVKTLYYHGLLCDVMLFKGLTQSSEQTPRGLRCSCSLGLAEKMDGERS